MSQNLLLKPTSHFTPFQKAAYDCPVQIEKQLKAIISLNAWLEEVGVTPCTAWRWRKKGWLNGSPKVISAVSSVIEKAAHFFYRNYTDEGKLASIPKKVETLESVLHLSDELKKRDISTDQLDESIKKASISIGNDLEKLLLGEELIELNGELIALTPSGQQNLIANRRVKMIQEKNPETNVP